MAVLDPPVDLRIAVALIGEVLPHHQQPRIRPRQFVAAVTGEIGQAHAQGAGGKQW